MSRQKKKAPAPVSSLHAISMTAEWLDAPTSRATSRPPPAWKTRHGALTAAMEKIGGATFPAFGKAAAGRASASTRAQLEWVKETAETVEKIYALLDGALAKAPPRSFDLVAFGAPSDLAAAAELERLIDDARESVKRLHERHAGPTFSVLFHAARAARDYLAKTVTPDAQRPSTKVERPEFIRRVLALAPDATRDPGTWALAAIALFVEGRMPRTGAEFKKLAQSWRRELERHSQSYG